MALTNKGAVIQVVVWLVCSFRPGLFHYCGVCGTFQCCISTRLTEEYAIQFGERGNHQRLIAPGNSQDFDCKRHNGLPWPHLAESNQETSP